MYCKRMLQLLTPPAVLLSTVLVMSPVPAGGEEICDRRFANGDWWRGPGLLGPRFVWAELMNPCASECPPVT